jgi:hypothetical protein
MRALHVRPKAELDMFEAALWYDREQSGPLRGRDGGEATIRYHPFNAIMSG